MGGSHLLDQSRGFQVGTIAGVEPKIRGPKKGRGTPTYPNRGSKIGVIVGVALGRKPKMG
jgi:hypothetical protein